MSLAIPTGGDRWQILKPKTAQQAETVATGCDLLPLGADGKEEVPATRPGCVA